MLIQQGNKIQVYLGSRASHSTELRKHDMENASQDQTCMCATEKKLQHKVESYLDLIIQFYAAKSNCLFFPFLVFRAGIICPSMPRDVRTVIQYHWWELQL